MVSMASLDWLNRSLESHIVFGLFFPFLSLTSYVEGPQLDEYLVETTACGWH